MQLSPDSIVAAASNQVSCDLGGETAILNVETGFYYSLDPVGARIWNLMRSPRTLASICAAMIEEYDVEPGRCNQDIIELLGKLASAGLIEIHVSRTV